ncbi:rhodanese-like domain-containing protein [Gordonia sp. NPDC003376]
MDPVSTGDIPQVPVTELPDDFSDDADRLLLDVREDDEWDAGHVRGAVHIPLGEVPSRIEEIDPDAELFVICHSSGRSMRVLAYLERIGYPGTCVEGGMLAWHQHGKPMVTGQG